MKHRYSYAFGIIVSTMAALCASTADAATTATGPYYANPSWDQQLPAATRFVVLSNWGGAAVLDRETGLVWEQSPLAPCLNPLFCIKLETGTRSWPFAQNLCFNKNVGGRGGWKLPSIQELRSLVDPTASNPALPAGHPFSNVQSSEYWTATTSVEVVSPTTPPFLTSAWVMNFSSGIAENDSDKTLQHFVWCVRGGTGSDAQ